MFVGCFRQTASDVTGDFFPGEMREDSTGEDADQVNEAAQAGADRNYAAADRSWDREREDNITNLQGSRDYGTDRLPLAERVWRTEAEASETTEGIGGGELPAQATGGGVVTGEASSSRGGSGKLVSSQHPRLRVGAVG